jgi:hypothetical protein
MIETTTRRDAAVDGMDIRVAVAEEGTGGMEVVVAEVISTRIDLGVRHRSMRYL